MQRKHTDGYCDHDCPYLFVKDCPKYTFVASCSYLDKKLGYYDGILAECEIKEEG